MSWATELDPLDVVDAIACVHLAGDQTVLLRFNCPPTQQTGSLLAEPVHPCNAVERDKNERKK